MIATFSSTIGRFCKMAPVGDGRVFVHCVRCNVSLYKAINSEGDKENNPEGTSKIIKKNHRTKERKKQTNKQTNGKFQETLRRNEKNRKVRKEKPRKNKDGE